MINNGRWYLKLVQTECNWNKVKCYKAVNCKHRDNEITVGLRVSNNENSTKYVL